MIGPSETAARELATARLLWASCHRHVPVDAVRAALDSGADVDRAVQAATAHRVAGLLRRALQAAGVMDLAGERSGALDDLAEVLRLRELLLVPEALRAAVEPLTGAGLAPVVLKGPAVARHYPGPGLRPFDDLDLLVTRREHVHALALLRRAGWQVVVSPAADRYDSTLVHPDFPDLPLELHHGLDSWHERSSTLRAGDLWAHRQPVELMGVHAYVLPVHEDLVMLCAHAAKPFHRFSRLVWIADLPMLVGAAEEAGTPVDWESVGALAVRSRCATAVAAALGLAAFAGAPSPEALRTLPDKGWRGEALRRLVDERWPMVASPPIHLRFALAETRWRRLQLAVGYTHDMPGISAPLWYVRNADHAVRRWLDLRLRKSRQGGQDWHPGRGRLERAAREHFGHE